MNDTINSIFTISIIGSGLLMTLTGFEAIKLKAKKPEDEKRMIAWRKRFGKFFKTGGIALLIIGGTLLYASGSKPATWTQLDKEELKLHLLNGSDFLQSLNRDTAELVITCFVDKYTKKFTIQNYEEQSNLPREQLLEQTIPIMKECFKLYGIKINEN